MIFFSRYIFLRKIFSHNTLILISMVKMARIKQSNLFVGLCFLFGSFDFSFQLDLDNVHISFINNGSHTKFKVSSPLGNGVNISNAWLAVGLNSKSVMVL